MRSGVVRRWTRASRLNHKPTLTVESLEGRRLLCIEGVGETGETVHETHLYDASGHHLMLDGIPDAGTIDIPVAADAGGTVGPLPSSGRRVIIQTGPMPVGVQAQAVTAADAAALASVPGPTGSLNGKIAYMNAGHGWTWGGSSWNTQRPEYSEVVEDLQTQDQMTFYANYMLNAGATVVPMRPVGHQLNELIVDNHDAGFSIVSGAWSTNSASSTYWSNVSGTDTTDRYRFASVSATETAVARWTPNIPQAGFYPVYAWWNNGSNRATDVTYRINSGGGSQEVKVNQKFTGKGWVYLGTYYFDQGTGNNVELSNKATNGSAVIADAIRFGNGVGDWTENGAHAVSGKSREEELSVYWLYRSRGYTASNTIVPESTIDNGGSDSSGGINGPPRWISYMNDETQGTNVDRLHLSFHSNGSTGDPATATARGTEGLLNNNVSWQTINQQWWANAVGDEVEEDMQALPAGMIESSWATRNNVYGSSNYGELNENNLDAFNSTAATTSEMAATILEVAFHDNTLDSQLLRDPKVRDWVGRASYQAAAKYFANFAGTSATLLPDPPTASRAVTDAAGNVTLNWTAPGSGAANGGAGAATGYKIYYGSNGYAWANAVTVANVATYTFAPGTLPAGMNYFKVVATNAGGESMQRDVVVAKTQASRRAPILIVNGYDRFDRTTDDLQTWSGNNGVTPRVRFRYQNTRDYVAQFAESVEAYNPNLGVESCQNEQVISGTINLANYQAVLWISGQESVSDKSFDATERTLITNYLNGGGKLFVSGSEIAFDLDGQAADSAFYENVLRANYVSDDANSYTTNGLVGSIFPGVSSIGFDNGSEAAGSAYTYDVEFPDVITTSGGSTAALSYSTGGTAAVQYSSGQTRVVTMGFPFETITSATKRNQVMAAVLSFFNVNSTFGNAIPGTPDLLAATDTGNLSTDNITNRNNSAAAKNLQFSVSGTVAGATVTICINGVVIGSAIAAGTTTTVTTNGSIQLLDGVRSITARQTEPGKSESGDSTALSLTVDTVAPTADVVDVSPDPRTTGVSSVAVNFNEAVTGFDLADLSLKRDGGANLLAGTNAPTTGNNVNFTVPNLLSPSSVSGSYVLALTAAASGIADIAGNAFAVNASDAWAHSLPAWLSAAGTAASWNSQTKALAVTGSATITADPASDQPAVTVSGATGVLTINPISGTAINLASLAINNGGQATMSAHGAGPVRALVVTGNPNIDATSELDLADNAMVIKNGNVAGIQASIAAAFNNGNWLGSGGITSGSAAANPTGDTALGFASNASLNMTTFAGVTGLTANDVLVKYTYTGDANLDGQVDIGDLGLLSGDWQQPSGKTWFDGDFTYEGAVDIGDLGLLSGNWQKGVGNPL